MEQYIRLKQRIFENQTPEDVAVLNMDDPVLFKTAEKLRARVAFFSRTQPVENGPCGGKTARSSGAGTANSVRCATPTAS
jgi:UDP-N-acetylmuramoylalanine--D-glutamate ligase